MSRSIWRTRWHATITRRSTIPRRCTPRSASVSRNRRRPSRTGLLACPGQAGRPVLQSGLQVLQGTQSFLSDCGIGVSAELLQVGHAGFVATRGQDKRQTDFLILGGRGERRIKRLTGGAVARYFCQERQSHPLVGARIQIVDEELQRAEFADFRSPQHDHGEGERNPRRRLAFVLPRLFDRRRVRRIAQARETFGRAGTQLLVLIVEVLLVGAATFRSEEY